MDQPHRRSDSRGIGLGVVLCYTALRVPPPRADSMERAARLIKNNKFSRQILTSEDIARAVWPTAVGKAIARHTSRIRLVRSTLIVEVADAVWQRQLHKLSPQILGRLAKLTGSAEIQDLEFRVAIPRREPQRAESNAGLFAEQQNDEADRIQDPVLKKIYLVSKKASA